MPKSIRLQNDIKAASNGINSDWLTEMTSLTISTLSTFFSRRRIEKKVYFFPRKQVLTFHVNCLISRQFNAWYVKTCFLLETIWMKCQTVSGEKKENIFQYVVCWKFYPECLALKQQAKAMTLTDLQKMTTLFSTAFRKRGFALCYIQKKLIFKLLS